MWILVLASSITPRFYTVESCSIREGVWRLTTRLRLVVLITEILLTSIRLESFKFKISISLKLASIFGNFNSRQCQSPRVSISKRCSDREYITVNNREFESVRALIDSYRNFIDWINNIVNRNCSQHYFGVFIII